MAPKRVGIDLDSITLTDDFMFGTVFQDPKLCKGLVEVLLGASIQSIEYVERQEMLDAGPHSRAGVVDLLVRDAAGNTFDLEMQNRADDKLAFRARRYLSLVDLMALRPSQHFDEARGAIIVFICLQDPFGRGWKRYNFPRLCSQDGKPLGDDTDIVIINAEGTRGAVGPELDAFLDYLRNGSPTGSDYVREVDDAVHSWRDNPLWRRYRVLWSEKYRNEFADAREEGERMGESRQLAQLSALAERLEADGRTAELPRALHDEDFRQQLLRKYGLL